VPWLTSRRGGLEIIEERKKEMCRKGGDKKDSAKRTLGGKSFNITPTFPLHAPARNHEKKKTAKEEKGGGERLHAIIDLFHGGSSSFTKVHK